MWRLIKWIMLLLIVLAALFFPLRNILEIREMLIMKRSLADKASIPEIDASVPDRFETATFAMG